MVNRDTPLRTLLDICVDGPGIAEIIGSLAYQGLIELKVET